MNILFYSAFIAFFAIHAIPHIGNVRNGLIDAIGKKSYIAIFALMAAMSLFTMLYAIRYSPTDMVPFSLYPKAYYASWFLMPLAFFLIMLRIHPGIIRTYFTNSAYIGILIWAGCHLLLARNAFALIMFSGFSALAVFLIIFRLIKPKAINAKKTPRLTFDGLSLLIGCGLSILLAYLHPLLLGVSNVYA